MLDVMCVLQPSCLQLLRTFVDQGKQKEVLLTEEDTDNAEDSRHGLPCAHVHL